MQLTLVAKFSLLTQKNKPVMLTHDGPMSPLALPAIDFWYFTLHFAFENQESHHATQHTKKTSPQSWRDTSFL